MIPIRDENPTQSFPLITVVLITINIMVYLFQLTMPAETELVFFHRFGAIPRVLTLLADPFPGDGFPVFLTMITSMFIHGGLLHVLGNMLFLWIFGNNIEDVLGHFLFTVFYLVCGVMAALCHVLTNPDSLQPMVGASGAIAGVMGGYLILFPRARVLTLFLIVFYPVFIWIPAVVVLGLWFLFQFLNAGAASGIAWTAHVGGFICGMILIKLMPKQRRPATNPQIDVKTVR
jgi:membrane associated rhomboid family serine protease